MTVMHFTSFIRLNQYFILLFTILFVFLPLSILYQQFSIPYEDEYLNVLNQTRYEKYCYRIEQHIKNEKLLKNDIQLDPKKEYIPYSYSQWQSTSLMPRLLTSCEHAILMNLLSILIKNVFEKYNIKYMMMAATLLGSYTRHDILPWDDDVDIRVSISDRQKLQSIIVQELSNEPYSIGIVTMYNERNYDKIYFTWCPRYSAVTWNFPFIDIFYQDENSTHVWLLGTPRSCPVLREDVYPLVHRPLGSLWLYGPRQPMAHFQSRRMGQIETGCYAVPYSHKYEKNMRSDILYADCSLLNFVYPHVKRKCTLHNCTEALMFVQESLTILCKQFPFVSQINNTNFQCARLRLDKEVSTSDFNLENPTQIILFIIIDLPTSSTSPVNIDINFIQSLNSPSSINDIRFALLVTHSNFTINNQVLEQYTPYNIPIFHWQNSVENNFDLIDLIEYDKLVYETDKSLCKWNDSQWNRLFNGNDSNDNNIPYVYFIKTTDVQFQFTMIDTYNTSILDLSILPSPYLDILYCIPYKLGLTEIILLICFGVIFIGFIITLCVLHYFKGGEDNRTRHFERYHNHHRNLHENFVRSHIKKVRRRSSATVASGEIEEDDEEKEEQEQEKKHI